MNTHVLALQLMAAQGCLGAFDTLYHHELTEALPQKPGARLELGIHATRAIIYALLFIGLAYWEWHGLFAVALLGIFTVEIVLTLWDFVVEDRTRLLPATERVTHTVLAINGGAFINNTCTVARCRAARRPAPTRWPHSRPVDSRPTRPWVTPRSTTPPSRWHRRLCRRRWTMPISR